MQPKSGSPAEWLVYARSDLALAQIRPPQEVMLETLTFHAQQAVEKCIKAVLVHYGTQPPKIHSIERLIDLLPVGVCRPPYLIASAGLTEYATVFRYPGMQERVSEKEYHEAVTLAEQVLQWAEGIVGA